MKKFTLTCTQDNEDNVQLKFVNEGFNGMEIVAVLETKKADLIEQFTHPEKVKYERVCTLENGSKMKKIKEGEEKPAGVVKHFENCARCAYDYGNSKCPTIGDDHNDACKTCDGKKYTGHCPCSDVLDGDVCPYFEEEKK